MTEHSGGTPTNQEALLQLLKGRETPEPDMFKQMFTTIDSHQVLAKVFILEGVPFVFAKSPMKYVIFREQVAERFDVGSQDVCIVGSAKLGYSPSPYKYGRPFHEESDVDVVIVSEPLFYKGSRELFEALNLRIPRRPWSPGGLNWRPVKIESKVWLDVQSAIRNFVYENFNPGVLPHGHPTRVDIFDKISTTAGLFLALEPQVFVSKIRCRIFRNWKAAENYYANTLREAGRYFRDEPGADIETDEVVEASGDSGAGDSSAFDAIAAEVDRLKAVSTREAVVGFVRTKLSDDPDNPDMHQLLGANLRKWAEEMLDTEPSSARAKTILEEAEVEHRKAIEIRDPECRPRTGASYHYALGRVQLLSGQREQAARSFHSALDEDPGYEKAKEYLELTKTT